MTIGSSILGGVCLLLLLRAVWEPTKLDVRGIALSSGRRLPAAAQPGCARRGPRIVLFSDLHTEHLRVRTADLLRAIQVARPDMILFAGDLAGDQNYLPQALDLMRQIRELPETADLPFIAVAGNHDGPEAIAALASLGLITLCNQGVFVQLQGQTWQVIGLDDPKHGRPDPAAALREADLAGVPPGRRMALAHNPDCLLTLPADRLSWFFAGHFHGGQIWMPFKLEFRLLRREKLPRIGYYKGRVAWGGLIGYISRGLGCVQLPLRLFSLPELTVIELDDRHQPD